MNLTGQDIHQKQPKAKPDPAYLSEVRQLPCCICDAFGETQQSPTQAHHVTHGRFGARKTPDRMAIPLCEGHHQGLRDTSKTALHREHEKWKFLYGEDHEWTAATQDRLAGET